MVRSVQSIRSHAVILVGHDEFGNHDARARALAGHAVELELIVRAVNHAQPLVDVAQPDAAALDPIAVIGRTPRRRCR